MQESVRLAQAGEELGYTRYWIAEHHDMSGLTCPAPEVMLAYIGAQTSKIRIGSGAILLPHYKPYKVAEVFNLLSILFPNRIDLGIGRAPGGPAEATIALSGNFLEQVRQLPEKNLKSCCNFCIMNFRLSICMRIFLRRHCQRFHQSRGCLEQVKKALF
ncbi:hypothetical protein GCM10020331_070670 [Ectobacillus funiculus]